MCMDKLVSSVAIRKGLNSLVNSYDIFSFDSNESTIEFTKKLKAFSEIILVAGICNDRDIRLNEIEHIFKWGWEYLSRGDRILELFNKFPYLSNLAVLYMRFFRFGFRNEEVEFVVHSLFIDDHFTAFYDRYWKREAVNLALNEIYLNQNRSKKKCKLELPTNVFCIWDKQVYDFTHQIFYYTNFGKANYDKLNLSTDEKKWISSFLPVFISYYAELGNFDIFCELIIAKQLLKPLLNCEAYGDIESNVKIEIVDLLTQKGIVPLYRKDGGPDYIDEYSYHSTIVAILMLAIENFE